MNSIVGMTRVKKGMRQDYLNQQIILMLAVYVSATD